MAVPRTRIKICGITSPEDACAAVDAGADAIGLVFYPPSKRYVEPERAALICNQLPAFVTVTGLFVDAMPSEVEAVLRQVPLDLLQFHGGEPDAFCQQFGKPYIKALRVRSGMDMNAEMAAFGGARGLLLDAYVEGTPGGTGKAFDWNLVPASWAGRIILAGGLDAANVGQAIARLQPYAVDVSGGVEMVPGKKSPQKIEEFVAAVRAADDERDLRARNTVQSKV